MHRLVCGVRLASLDAGDPAAPPLNKKIVVVSTDRLLCAPQLRGGAGVSPASSEAGRSPHTRQCIHKAVQMQGATHKMLRTKGGV